VQDHLLVGTPGTPTYQAGICAHCGLVLELSVAKLGQELTIQVEHAQQTANERDTPAASRAPRLATPRASDTAARTRRRQPARRSTRGTLGGRSGATRHRDGYADVLPRIMLVEADATRRRRAAEALRAAHYEVHPCPEPAAAFACACQTHPDLVILDISATSGRLGYRVLNQLKQQEETQAIPIVLTVPPTPAWVPDRQTLAERGVYVLPDPVRPAELPGRVAEVLALPRAAEEALT
jgi:CheY-like chemotaxis protein